MRVRILVFCLNEQLCIGRQCNTTSCIPMSRPMIFITPTAGTQSAKDYFIRGLASADYYARDAQELPGQWHGLGADLLGISGEVKQADFFALCDNRNPVSGERLTPRTKPGRRVYYDFTFDVPKAVTLVLELGEDERVLDAFRESVQDTMDEMEAQMHARVRKGGANAERRTANLVWAEFLHRTTRPVDGIPDPQLHCHAVVFNATYDSTEECWKAGEFAPLVRDKLYYQSAFHARLAGRLQSLGYDVQRDGTSFTLAGINRDTVLKFSRRTALVEAVAERRGVTNAKARGELGRRTREPKLKDAASLVELRRVWQERLTDAEREALRLTCSGGAGALPQATEAAFAHALQAFEHKHEMPEAMLVAETLMQGVGHTSVDDAWEQAMHPGLLLRHCGGQALLTTRNARQDFRLALAFVQEGRGQHRRLGGISPGAFERVLNERQQRAATKLLASRDQVVCLSGADAGRALIAQKMQKTIEAGGRQVFLLDASSIAAADANLGFSSEALKAVRKQVLWVERARDVPLRDMKRVFELARRQDCRVVLSDAPVRRAAASSADLLQRLEREGCMTVARFGGKSRQSEVRDTLAQRSEQIDAMPIGGVRRLVSMRRVVRSMENWRERTQPVPRATHQIHREARYGRL